MQKHLLYLSFIAVSFSLIPGCEKDDDPGPPPAKTKTELISTGSWKFEKAMAGTTDISTQAALACYIDNTMTFSSNLTGTMSEGVTACTNPAPTTFAWAFQPNETTLHLDFTLFTGGSPDFTIVSLTEANLVLSQTMTIAPYPATTITVTFKH